MSPKHKTFLLTIFILFCGFFLWVTFAKRCTVAVIIIFILATIGICWRIFNQKIPQNTHTELSDASKKRVDEFMYSPEGKKIINDLGGVDGLFKKKNNK